MNQAFKYMSPGGPASLKPPCRDKPWSKDNLEEKNVFVFVFFFYRSVMRGSQGKARSETETTAKVLLLTDLPPGTRS